MDPGFELSPTTFQVYLDMEFWFSHSTNVPIPMVSGLKRNLAKEVCGPFSSEPRTFCWWAGLDKWFQFYPVSTLHSGPLCLPHSVPIALTWWHKGTESVLVCSTLVSPSVGMSTAGDEVAKLIPMPAVP